MTYAVSEALQRAVYTRLTGDAALTALVGGDIYDALPPGVVPPQYVTLGAERVRGASDQSGAGAWHDLVISVVSDATGFQIAKAIAVAINDALSTGSLALSRGHLVGLHFLRAKAQREGTHRRRIDMTFRARVSDS